MTRDAAMPDPQTTAFVTAALAGLATLIRATTGLLAEVRRWRERRARARHDAGA